MDIRSLLNHFEAYLITQRRVSPNTVSAYRNDLEQFIHFLDGKGVSLESLKVEDLSAFLAFLKSQQASARTLSRKVSSLKAFFSYAHEHHQIYHYAQTLVFPKLEKKLPNYLLEHEIKELFDRAEEDKTATGIRNKTMLYLLYATGLRITELVTLPISSVDFETGFVTVLGKGGKERMVPVPDSIFWMLSDYLKKTRKDFMEKNDVLNGNDPLFPVRYGKKIKPLTRQAFWMILKQLAKGTSVEKKISPHQLRHTLATQLLNKGADLRSLQLLLGHENLSTVQIYTHLDIKRLRTVYDKKHPRS